MPTKDALTETTERVTAAMNAQVELGNKCYALYQAQTEKALKFWMDAATKAMDDGQKAMKEWADLATAIASDARKTCEANVKEATRMFKPAA